MIWLWPGWPRSRWTRCTDRNRSFGSIGLFREVRVSHSTASSAFLTGLTFFLFMNSTFGSCFFGGPTPGGAGRGIGIAGRAESPEAPEALIVVPLARRTTLGPAGDGGGWSVGGAGRCEPVGVPSRLLLLVDVDCLERSSPDLLFLIFLGFGSPVASASLPLMASVGRFFGATAATTSAGRLLAATDGPTSAGRLLAAAVRGTSPDPMYKATGLSVSAGRLAEVTNGPGSFFESSFGAGRACGFGPTGGGLYFGGGAIACRGALAASLPLPKNMP